MSKKRREKQASVRPPVEQFKPTVQGKRLCIGDDAIRVEDARLLPRFRGRKR